MSRVFISYRRIDQHFAIKLATDIRNTGHNVWLDQWNIKGREPFFDEIKKGIEESTHFVFIVTPDSVDNDSKALDELGYADLLKPHPNYVPVVARPTPPVSFPLIINPGRHQFHDFTIQPYADALKKLLLALESSTGDAIEVPLNALAVMGTRGGIGKGTFVACSAQILAEAGYDVAIVDLDIEGNGSMLDARRRWNNLPVVQTVFDQIAPYIRRLNNQVGNNAKNLWDVTPDYLRDRKLGRIWMVPAANENNLYKYEVVADIPVPREPVLLEIIKQLVARIREQQPSVRFVLFDCGAGLNPIFSAGFEMAIAGYILLSPDAAYFSVVDQIKNIHANRFPGSPNPRLGIFTVANFIISEEDIKRLEVLRPSPIAYIPRNPAMQQYAFRSPVDFDLGFDDVYRAVHQALQKSLEYEVKLPSEFEIRRERWWQIFLKYDLARQTLQSNEFKIQTIGRWAVTIVSGIVAFAFIAINIYERFITAVPRGIDSFLIFAVVLLCAGSGYLTLRQHRRRLLLQESSQLSKEINDTHREFLDNLRKKDPKLLDYLNQLVAKHQNREKANRR